MVTVASYMLLQNSLNHILKSRKVNDNLVVISISK